MNQESSKIGRSLDERESAVLRALVYEYILSGKPVGSRTFVLKYSFSISPATMRNIMSDLENMGYLMQPHTSSGRIPTDRGYRFYVDSLLENYNFEANNEVNVDENFMRRELQLDKVYYTITKMLSTNSRYAGVMLTPRPGYAVVKRIELVSLGNNEVLLIMVTRTGLVVNRKVVISVNLTQENLYEYSKYLTAELCGYSIYEVRDKLFVILRAEKSITQDKDIALDIAELGFAGSDDAELHIDGIENLLKIPEMVEEVRLKSLLHIIEEKNILRHIMEMSLEIEGVRTLIGDEIPDDKVHGCSMVTSTYKIGNSRVGVVGVIGPTRMDYEKVVPLVDYTGKFMSDLLTRLSK